MIPVQLKYQEKHAEANKHDPEPPTLKLTTSFGHHITHIMATADMKKKNVIRLCISAYKTDCSSQ